MSAFSSCLLVSLHSILRSLQRSSIRQRVTNGPVLGSANQGKGHVKAQYHKDDTEKHSDKMIRLEETQHENIGALVTQSTKTGTKTARRA